MQSTECQGSRELADFWYGGGNLVQFFFIFGIRFFAADPQKVRSTAAATNINRGIYDAIEQSDKMKLPEENHVFLVTDGEFALNPFTKSLVEKRKDIRLTCVIVGKGPSAEKAVKYVTEELKLKVITLVNEEADVKKLAELVKSTVIDIQ